MAGVFSPLICSILCLAIFGTLPEKTGTPKIAISLFGIVTWVGHFSVRSIMFLSFIPIPSSIADIIVAVVPVALKYIRFVLFGFIMRLLLIVKEAKNRCYFLPL